MKLGIVSDIHEDIIRLEEALRLLEKLKCDEVACLGDIVGFSIPNFSYFKERNANACVDLVKKTCKWVVAGNHDLGVVQRIPQFDAGFSYPPNWYSLPYQERIKLAGESVWPGEDNEMNALLSDSQIEFLQSIPEFAIAETPQMKILLSHYLFPDLVGMHRKYFEDFGPVLPHLEFIEQQGCQIGISGHKHPEGGNYYQDELQVYKPFGSHQLNDGLGWIVGPCVANTKVKNGCMVFDTIQNSLELIPLNTPPRILAVVELNPTK